MQLLNVNSVLESLACLECGRLSCRNENLFLGSGVDCFLLLLVSYLKSTEAYDLYLIAVGESLCDGSYCCVKSLLGILSMAITKDTVIDIIADGVDETEAIEGLTELLNGGIEDRT